MEFGSACLFNKKPEDMGRVGRLGGRARARNLRLRKAGQMRATGEFSHPHARQKSLRLFRTWHRGANLGRGSENATSRVCGPVKGIWWPGLLEHLRWKWFRG